MLNDRARHLLKVLVEHYIEDGQPVGSRTLSKQAGLSLSPASIRNIMADLEEGGYIVSPHTSAGYFFPLALLRKEGISEPAGYFSRTQFSGSHDAAVWMVANDIADMGAAKNTVYDELLERKPELTSRVEILYKGGHYPDATLCLKKETPTEIREALRTVFLGMSGHKDGLEVLKSFGANRFVSAAPDDFETVRKVVAESGYDLKKMKISQ